MNAVMVGLLAFLLIIAVGLLMPKLGRFPSASGIAGGICGFLIGLIAHVVISVMHFFGPIDIPEPAIQLGPFATTLGLPIILGVVGLIAGIAVGTIRRKNNS